MSLEKTNLKLDSIKTKPFCSARQRNEGTKRQISDWKNLFAKHISDNKLV